MAMSDAYYLQQSTEFFERLERYTQEQIDLKLKQIMTCNDFENFRTLRSEANALDGLIKGIKSQASEYAYKKLNKEQNT